jgi:serine/threonine-protein kinase
MGRSKLIVPRAALALAVLLAPAKARAQSAEDKAAAEAAFEEGKRLMVAHAYAEACPKFAESLRRDPGIGTMLGLADCFEKNGQTASAWAEFREAAGAAARKSDRRESLARDNAARLGPLLSRVVVRLAPDAELPGLVVRRDGNDIGLAALGAEVPVDPGVHAIAASAPGYKEWQITLEVVAKPGTQTVTIPKLEPAPPAPEASAPATAPSSAPAGAPASGDDGHTQRIVAIAVGGAGVVGVVLGSIFGLEAKSKLDDSNANGLCQGNACLQQGLNLRQDAKSASTVSTVAFVLGGAAIAGGAVLWFTAPTAGSRASVGLAPAPSLGGAALVGHF